jgi:hypothetical protein
VDFSSSAWFVSVVAVLISGFLAWLQGDLRKGPHLDMGFANHGGMWGDLLLLPLANALIVPHLVAGPWIGGALILCSVLSVWVHIHWYRGDSLKQHSREHMWPSRPHRSWWKDLSPAGWAHVAYVAGELSLLLGFLLFPMPETTVVLVAVIFSLHLPLGLLQPRWFVTGEIATPRKQPLLVPCLAALWTMCLMKVV